MSKSYEDYTWKGDTFWMAESVTECPDCDAAVSTNGKILSCIECEWWEVLEDDD